MNLDEYKELTLEELGTYVPSVSSDALSNDFFISKVRSGSDLTALKHPFRFDGYFAYFCRKGQFRAEINLKEFDITEGTLLLYAPGNIIRLVGTQEVNDSQFVVLAISRKILQNAKIDFSKLYEEAISVLENPCIRLEPDEVEICANYYRLSEKLIQASKASLELSLMELGSSLFHYLGSIWKERISKGSAMPTSSLRSKMIFEEFTKLVIKNHAKEREVGFYAKKMNLSPKYLSQLVKKTSGKSAPDWISSFVILEAKNYLKYSNMDVKEIAFKLNFSSASVFFRYFKANTGMTPLEYRKS